MKIHISYFLLPGTEFSFPSVVLPNLSTKKLGREIQRDGRYNASGVRGGREGRRAWKLARARLRSTAGGLKKPAVGTAHRRAPLRLVPPSSTFSIFRVSLALCARQLATNRVRQAGRLRHAATPDRAASGRHCGDHSGIKQAGEGDSGCQPAAPVPAKGGGGLR